MSHPVQHIPAQTYHGRKGEVRNAFTYGIDYVLLDVENPITTSRLFGRNRSGLMSLWDRDHGGAPKHGAGVSWLRDRLAEYGLADVADGQILLLAQPRILGHVFNPVSFWLIHDATGALRVVMAEVSNTFGDRHSYLCHNDDLSPIGPDDVLEARKVFHVSPFQRIEGGYRFTYDISDAAISIRIDYRSDGDDRLLATLQGPRQILSARNILTACLRRPFGSRRVLGLIHWQALRLWWKGARFVSRPTPPTQEVSR